MGGIPQDSLPIPINDDFKPIDQRNVIHIFAYSKTLNQRHPERIKKFDNFNFYERNNTFMKGPYRNSPGYSQIERALAVGGFSMVTALHGSDYGLNNPDGIVSLWKQDLAGLDEI